MAKDKQVSSNNGNASLALPDGKSATGLAVPDDVDGLAFLDELDIDDDGLGQIDQGDVKLSVKIFNSKATLANGDPIPANQFFDTVTEQVARELELIWLKDHKTNEWREYDADAARSVIECSSQDRITGTMADGTKRPCEGCPDAQWTNQPGPDGKMRRTRRCGPVHNMFAIELETMQPCVMRFRRTSLQSIQTYLSRYHIKRRAVLNKTTKKLERQNVPLFAYSCKVSLKMSDDKKYALPVLERGSVLSPDAIRHGQDQLTYVNAVLMARLPKAIESDQSVEDEAGLDTSFDTSKMSGGHGQDFVDPAPATGVTPGQ